MAKVTKIRTLKQNSSAELSEVGDAMYHQSAQVLPEALAGALQGKTAQAAKEYLATIKRPELEVPIRQQIYRSVELNVAKVERAATHYARYLADSEHEAIVRYKQALDET